jgi:hypothetical protein
VTHEKRCAECGGTNLQDEPGQYALLQLKNGNLEIDARSPAMKTMALVVQARICADCNRIAFFKVA